MAAAENQKDWWLDQQRLREERMRYEVLSAIYHATERFPCVRIDTTRFLEGLGVWREELEGVLHFLVEHSYVSIDDQALGETGAPGQVVCITQRGIDYIQRGARRRRTIRDEAPPDRK